MLPGINSPDKRKRKLSEIDNFDLDVSQTQIDNQAVEPVLNRSNSNISDNKQGYSEPSEALSLNLFGSNKSIEESESNTKKQVSFPIAIENFFKRLIPENFPYQPSGNLAGLKAEKISNYKPGLDYYSSSFAILLTILFYVMFFYGDMIGRGSGKSFTESFRRQQFSKDLILNMLIIVLIILLR